MKQLLVVVLVLAVALGNAVAGDNAKPITKAGNTALMFDLGGLAALSANNYQGGFGAKYYISNGFAVRLGLGFSSSSTTTQNPADPVPTTQLSESKFSSTSFTVAPGIQYNVASTAAVVAYVGAQIAFTTGKQERDGNANNFGVGFTKDHMYTESSSTFGGAAFVGVEWFAWDNISLRRGVPVQLLLHIGECQIQECHNLHNSRCSVTTTLGIGSGNAAALTLSVFF